jgi:hypothetical protein
MTDATLDITPKTRVGDLLDAYPQLEAVLIEHAPVFAKLKNPLLRRTVARVATVERAAGVAGTPVRALVSTLRAAAGLAQAESGPPPAETPTASAPPAWATGPAVACFDADAMLASGEVPLGPVMARARQLDPGELLIVTASFRPTPLQEMLEGQGFRCHIEPGFRLLVAR